MIKQIYTNILERLFKRHKTEQIDMRESRKRHQLDIDVRDFLNNSVVLYPQYRHDQGQPDWPTILQVSPVDTFATVRTEAITLPMKTPSGKLH